MFLAAMVAKHQIDLKGNGILTDSFDSGESLEELLSASTTPTMYAGRQGDVASNDGVVGTIGVRNAKIYGKAHTGPEGTVTIGNQGGVGTHAWQAQRNGGLQDGYVLQDANFTFPDTGLPYDVRPACRWAAPQTIVTVTYDYSKTTTNSTVYPNPPPWSGVTQNYCDDTADHQRRTRPRHLRRPVTISYAGTSWNENDATPTTTSSAPTTLTLEFYHTNAIYTTNHYDHVLTQRRATTYTTDDLHGSTIVLGNARAGPAERPEHERQ